MNRCRVILCGALRRSAPDEQPRGQILVMFALMVTVFAGMLGLALDVGYAYSQRRTVQNAADAAAMAGARMVAKWTSATPTSAQSEAQTLALMATNKIASTNQTLQSCDYVDYAGNSQGACGATVPINATGVRVVVTETHPTWFIQAIPGAADTVTTSATATAHVEEFNGATAGPIIVCGKSTTLRSGGSFSILDASNQINPAAYNKEYQLHGPGIADCDAKSSSFKGTAIRNSNRNDDKGPGDDWVGDTGNQVGPLRFKVNGIKGCQKDQIPAAGCVLILPIATNSPAPEKKGNEFTFRVTQLGAFLITDIGSGGRYYGKLLDDYSVSGDSEETWCRDCTGTLVIRMTE